MPQGGEFVVDGGGRQPDVAMNTSGSFEVVWFAGEIRAQRFNAVGAPSGPGIQVNAYTTDNQFEPTVAFGDDGSALVFWSSFGEFGGAGSLIAGRRFNADGTPAGPDFQANSMSTNFEGFAEAASNASGDVVLAWISGPDVTLVGDVYGRRFGIDGVPRGGRVLVQTRIQPNFSSDQNRQSVALDAAGNHVVVWQDDGRTSNTSPYEYNVAMRRFSAAGVPAGDEERVNTTLIGAQYDPAVAMNAAGAFAVVWVGNGPQGMGLYLQHFDAVGVRRGGEVLVSASAGRPEVVLGARGDAVVVWARPDGQVVLRRIDRDGSAVSGEVLVGTTPSVAMEIFYKDLAVASNEAGSLVVVWPGTNGGVFGQRFALTPVAGEAAPEAPAALAVSVAPVPAGASGATVRYTLAAAGETRVTVVDALGREVAVLADGDAAAGAHEARFETAGLPSGVYAVRVEAGGAVAVVRVPVVR